jgi:hypothetical protein
VGTFRRLQLVSAAFDSLGHGANDAQKTMGIIAVPLYSTGYLGGSFYVPVWVVFACSTAIARGTLAGGSPDVWRNLPGWPRRLNVGEHEGSTGDTTAPRRLAPGRGG